jgi:hypothetical protein
MVPAPNADPAFLAILEPFSLERLQAEDNAVFGLWPNLRLAYVNPAGERLVHAAAPALGTWGVGSSILPALPERLRFFYVEEMQRVLASAKIFRHLEPPQGTGMRGRRVQMLPLWGSGLLLYSVPVTELPAPGGPLEALYRGPNGFLLSCSYCHTYKRAGEGEHWEWVPAFAEHTPAQTTHGVCHFCFGYHSR